MTDETTTITIRISAKKKRKAIKLADADGRTLSNWVERLIDRELSAAPTQQQTDEWKPDLSKCPECGGPADNGWDRDYPPSPYNCTKCEAKDGE